MARRMRKKMTMRDMSDARVMVFAPAPQLTVTIEQHHDEPELHVHPGGQGIWQTRMITSLGAHVTLCAAAGGEVGRVLSPLLSELPGVTLRLVMRGTAAGGTCTIAAAAAVRRWPSGRAPRCPATSSTSSTT